MEVGQVVKVYDGDLVGFTTAVLLDQIKVIENDGEQLERWRMETSDGTKLVRFVRNSYDAKKDGCGYLIEEEKEFEKSFYCKGSGESQYDISGEYYINTFEDADFIDICYCENPEVEGVTIDRKDILKIAEIIKFEDRNKREE